MCEMNRYAIPFFWITALLGTLALTACMPAEPKDDPLRTEFVEACMGRIEYRAMQPDKRSAYCKCGYDRTLSGLSEEEKKFARFYLLEQVGVDAGSKQLITKPDMDAMLKASKAIGQAVRRCK